jgi:2-polyprenyl-3-methyl-5-hydroxy-6-metoxy-1,4-benzoquinol methylase
LKQIVNKIANKAGFSISKFHKGYDINLGYSQDSKYNERMIELPFIYRHIIKPPAKVLDIGCSESILGITLAINGYDVTGIDINDYNFKYPSFKFIKDDFLEHKFKENFDVIINLSAIEHFGLLAYDNKVENINADLEAMDKIYELLKPNGQLLFTAPFGESETIPNFERHYDKNDLHELFVQFKIQNMLFPLPIHNYNKDVVLIEAYKV